MRVYVYRFEKLGFDQKCKTRQSGLTTIHYSSSVERMVNRDREARLIWLFRSNCMDKVVGQFLFLLTPTVHPPRPLLQAELMPHDGRADFPAIKLQ